MSIGSHGRLALGVPNARVLAAFFFQTGRMLMHVCSCIRKVVMHGVQSDVLHSNNWQQGSVASLSGFEGLDVDL